MVRLRKILLVGVFSGILLSACGKKDSDDPAPQGFTGASNPNIPATSLYYDTSVPSDQKGYLQKDVSLIGSLSINNTQPKTESFYKGYTDAKLLSVSDFAPSTLKQWLYTRVKVVVGESLDWRTKISAITLTKFPSPELLADEAFSAVTPVTIMSNTGAAIYRDGKQQKKIYDLQLNGTKISILSPRVGVIQIGQGLFTANQIKGSPTDSIANSFMRLATLFHEGRHDDSNGTNVAFPHAVCPSGDFAGSYACENNINGPYAIEAILMRRIYDACTSCSESEKKALQAAIADSQSRLFSSASYRDDRPEGFTK